MLDKINTKMTYGYRMVNEWLIIPWYIMVNG